MTLNMGKTPLLNGTIIDASLKIYHVLLILIRNFNSEISRKALEASNISLGTDVRLNQNCH